VTAEGFRSRTVGTEQLVMVVGGALVGYISVARAQTRAQLTAILVDPACRRAGLGSELLAEARRNLGGGVKSWSAGSGAGPDFWLDQAEQIRAGRRHRPATIVLTQVLELGQQHSPPGLKFAVQLLFQVRHCTHLTSHAESAPGTAKHPPPTISSRR
jgi:GNAT superfamily N-acetyltransferase